METMWTASQPVTFERKKKELYTLMNAKLDSDDFDAAQEIFDKLVRLDERRKHAREFRTSIDTDHKRSLLMEDPIYSDAVASSNTEVIEAFNARRVTEERYLVLRDRLYEKMFAEKEISAGWDSEAKKALVDDILTTVNGIYRVSWEARGDMLAMHIMDFLSSDKAVHEFDIGYLQRIAERVHRYASLMQKISHNKEMIVYRAEEEKRRAEEEQKRIEAQKKYEEICKIHAIYRDLNEIYDQIVEKEKVFYEMIERLCKCTHDETLRISGPSGAQTYARCKVMGAFRDGLPYSMPQEFMEYMKKHGTPNGLELLERAKMLMIGINALQKQLSERHVELIGKPSLDEEGNVYYANSSKVFTSSDIPVPINKMAWRGMAGIRKGRKKKQIA